MHVIAAKGVAFKEAFKPEFKDYQFRIIKNAKKLAQDLSSKGFRLVSEKHRSVAVRYGAIRREIEYLLSLDTSQLDLDEVTKIKERFDNLSSDAPEISKKIWDKVETDLEIREKTLL